MTTGEGVIIEWDDPGEGLTMEWDDYGRPWPGWRPGSPYPPMAGVGVSEKGYGSTLATGRHPTMD